MVTSLLSEVKSANCPKLNHPSPKYTQMPIWLKWWIAWLMTSLPKEKLTQLQDKYLRLKSCPFLIPPNIYKQVWLQIRQETTNAETKSFRLAGIYAFLHTCNEIQGTYRWPYSCNHSFTFWLAETSNSSEEISCVDCKWIYNTKYLIIRKFLKKLISQPGETLSPIFVTPKKIGYIGSPYSSNCH